MMFPKPGTRRRAGIVRVGDREICRTDYQWQKRRQEVFERDKGKCRRCNRFAPLHDELDPETGEVRRRAGHAMHGRARKMGGGFRDDRLENLDWGCWRCHDREHRPQKVVPRK
jgi:5-methylcytosine-specific restriction endonuclease McrA